MWIEVYYKGQTILRQPIGRELERMDEPFWVWAEKIKEIREMWAEQYIKSLPEALKNREGTTFGLVLEAKPCEFEPEVEVLAPKIIKTKVLLTQEELERKRHIMVNSKRQIGKAAPRLQKKFKTKPISSPIIPFERDKGNYSNPQFNEI